MSRYDWPQTTDLLRIGPFPIRFDDPGLWAGVIGDATFRPTGKKLADLKAGTIVLAGWGVVTEDWEGPDGPSLIVSVGPPVVPETPQFVTVGTTPLLSPNSDLLDGKDGANGPNYFIGVNAIGAPVFAAALEMLAIANTPASLYAQAFTAGPGDDAELTSGAADVYALVMPA
jgi:hypothetical protein